MATRSHTSFQKRQKEIARVEKQREKAAKRMQRKQMGRESRAPENTGDEEARNTADESPMG
jgi:hypothetical protein